MRRFRFKNNKWKRVISLVLAIALFTGGVALIANFASSKTKTVNPVFAVGALDANGEYVESKNSVYTKQAFKCRGIQITPDFDSNVEYQVFYYGEQNQFVGASEVLTKGQHVPMSDLAVYARVVITPYDSKNMNVEIKVLDVAKYARSVKITVDRDQDYEVPNLFEEAKKNTYKGEASPNDMAPNELLKYSFFEDCSFSISQESLKITSAENTVGKNVCIIPCSDIVSLYFDSDAYMVSGIAYCITVDPSGNYLLEAPEVLYNDFIYEIPGSASYFVVETDYNLEITVHEYK